MSIRLLALLCLIGGSLSTPFTRCVKNPATLLEKMSFGGCEDFPCRLKYGTDVRLVYQLTMPHAVSKIDKEVWMQYGDKPLRLARVMDGCEFIKCPVEAGQTVQYSKIVAMPDDLPMGLQEYEIHFKDGETGESLACGKYQLIFYDDEDEQQISKEK